MIYFLFLGVLYAGFMLGYLVGVLKVERAVLKIAREQAEQQIKDITGG